MFRAMSATRGSHTRRRFLIGAIVGAIALVAGVTGSLSANGDPFGLWTPGISGAVSAPAGSKVVQPSPRLADIVSESAASAGGSAAEAISGLRLLQSGLGAGGVALYSFSPGSGALCLVVYDRSVVCPTAESSPTPGVLWVYDGGYSPNVAGSPGYAPPAIAGLVSDRVAAVALAINGSAAPLDLTSSTFFKELDPPRDLSDPFVLSLLVTYRDGTTARADLGDPRGDRLSAAPGAPTAHGVRV